ncbi:DEAD/DEAH box helicase [Methylobacterium indicum]|uniref:DEAD/DEAH box helicase n=1 Tax=Methylobacterium indicum TaxID=1775910 RepID=UPI0009EA0757|nr:DEAD/DEAH box helicase family protein [Methylobacterium indicum]
MSAPSRPLRSHQRSLSELVAALARGEASGIGDILAAVTPGGGKSLLPVIAASKLIAAGIVERVVWIVPRDSLRLQAEEAFADPAWRAALGHDLSVRAADNSPDPSRGLSGYVTTYQAVAAAPALHLAEMRRHRTLLVVDEVHHLPALAEGDAGGEAARTEAAAWSQALLPLFRAAHLRLLLSGTLERADGRRILWLPYRTENGAPTPDIDAPGWAVIGYSRAEALAEKAVLPVNFGALDGEASWLEGGRTSGQARVGPHRLSGSGPSATTRPALFTALRTGFARDLLREAFFATRRLRAERRRQRGLRGTDAVRGLGKLLVVAPDQASAQSYHAMLQAWMPEEQARRDVRIATSAEADAHAALAAFRLTPEPAVLVTVAMAYEGLDAPEVAVVAALTHIRSRPWLEQMIARATRVDPHAGDYADQHALVFHPDDPLFAQFRARIETEQATATRPRKRPAGAGSPEPRPPVPTDDGIVPLESNALGLRYAMLRPGPSVALARPEAKDGDAVAVPPSRIERALRARVAAMVTAQAVEDEAELRRPGGAPLPHRYNAVLKRLFGNKSRAAMTAEELESALAWLERNRLQDHLHLLDGDTRYAWSVRRRWAGMERRPG